MKRYTVITQDGVDQHYLHSFKTNEEYFTTFNYEEALHVYDNEVKQLEKEYIPISDLDYDISDRELIKCVQVTLIVEYLDEDGEVDVEDTEIIENSEYFYPYD